ncbi:MAG: hypothetical protein AB1782_01460 [Cyanobacteriota bacterium]
MKIKIARKSPSIKHTPIENKQFFIGVALGDNPTVETGIAVLNRNLQLIRVDKVLTNSEVISFINNFSGTVDSLVTLSLAPNTIQLSSKWREDEKNIHAFKLYDSAEDMYWTDRYSERGKDIYEALNGAGITTFRYNIYIAKMTLNLIPPFKTRSQPGCKYLQTVIRDYLSVDNLPNNLIPIASLDALVGAYTGWKVATDKVNVGYKFLEPFKGQQVVAPLKINPRPISDAEDVAKSKKKKKKKRR